MICRAIKRLFKRAPHLEIRGRHVAIVGANGETMFHSEQYTRGSDARRAAESFASETGWRIVEKIEQRRTKPVLGSE